MSDHGPHVCGAWCRPPVHCILIFADTHDVGELVRKVRADIRAMGLAVQIVSIERARDAPPRSYFGDRLFNAADPAHHLDDTATAYRVWYMAVPAPGGEEAQ